jgi:hypothetical protein
VTASASTAQMPRRFAQRAYGIDLDCEFREIEASWEGEGELVHETLVAGAATLRIERGAAGDHLIRCGEHRFHLSTDHSQLVCPRPSGADPLWWNALLDWVPYSAATLSGLLCIHAAGVLVDGRVLAVAAGSGAGKSTLALELLAAGATFFCDDVLTVEPTAAGILAHPGPRLAKVAAGRPDLVERFGRPLGRAGEEVLVEVAEAAVHPAPIGAVVILDRSGEGEAPPRLLDEGLPGLRRLVVGLPAPPERELERFETLAALVMKAPVLRLHAGDGVAATDLARYLLEALPEARERWAR